MPKRGYKICPGCQAEIAAVRKKCTECDHVFVKKEKAAPKQKPSEAKVQKVEKVQKIVQKQQPEELPKNFTGRSDDERVIYPAGKKQDSLTPKQHAYRILKNGYNRAEALLRQSKRETWGHVDWSIIERAMKKGWEICDGCMEVVDPDVTKHCEGKRIYHIGPLEI